MGTGFTDSTDVAETMTEIVAQSQNVWKVFGQNPEDAIRGATRDGLTRDEINEKFGCVVAVRDVSIKVRRGEIYCVMGLSGSGKSTLIRHFNRLLQPTAGSVLVNGEDLGTKSDAELRAIRSSRISMVFQNFALLPHRTVRDNVALPMEINGLPRIERWKIAENALEMVGLDGWGDRYTNELSGGMQQRVGLARGLASGPDLLLMDEPFSALDPLIRRQLQEEFIRLRSETSVTTIFITHDLDEAIRIGNRIAIMKDGMIVQTGKPEDIVLAPQDAYVAEFVSGISTVGFVRAADVMQPLTDQTKLPDDRCRVRPDATLDELLDLAVTGPEHIVVEADGKDIGHIPAVLLLARPIYVAGVRLSLAWAAPSRTSVGSPVTTPGDSCLRP